MFRKFNLLKPIDLSLGIASREQVEKVKSLQTSFEQGQMSRRSFMMGAMALGVSMTAATGLVGRAEAATPKKGGRLRIGLTGGATSDILDPGQILDLYMLNVQFGQVRNGLTEVASNGDLIPELAESWEATPDAKVWTFKIRKENRRECLLIQGGEES